MAQAYIDLLFTGTKHKNASAQVGDNVYYVNTSTSGGFTVGQSPVSMGTIKSITETSQSITITVNVDSELVVPTTDSFILFNKENLVNTSALKGYYGNAEFKNNSIVAAELFATSCEVTQSSK